MSSAYAAAAISNDAVFPEEVPGSGFVTVTCCCGGGLACPYNSPHIRVRVGGYNDNPASVFFAGSVFVLGGYDTRRPGTSEELSVVLAPPVLPSQTLPSGVVRHLKRLHLGSPVFFYRPGSAARKAPSPPSGRRSSVQRAYWRDC